MRTTRNSDATDKPKNLKAAHFMKTPLETQSKNGDIMHSTIGSSLSTKKRRTKLIIDHGGHENEDAVLIDDNSSNDSNKKLFGG